MRRASILGERLLIVSLEWSRGVEVEGSSNGVWSGALEDHMKRMGGFLKHVRLEVGDSRRIQFWNDIWCGDIPLSDVFPKLYARAANKDAGVGDYCKYLRS